ncbi:hypothetical protein NHX12_023105 [Muraenolepis orangiensis]|uniref:Uncharacterized protein n=1 Tax=Muraenolepis orangiensis TaxID=630683 RepID=A0A9Q0IRR1_9TELE|nr:hypothetical protein NHX12_023105 [Muraenolepis orangiensis]
MEEKGKDYPELSDPKWIMDLAFLVDMLSSGQTEPGSAGISAFPSLLKASGQATGATLKKQTAPYATLVEALHENFASRFHDLQLKRSQITFLVDPFNAETDCLKAPLVTDEAVAELEMIKLSEEDRLKPEGRDP